MNIRQKPQAGEIWIADLGTAGKIRPVLVLYYPKPDDSRMLAIVAPIPSQIRGCNGENDITHKNWLPNPSAINFQGLGSIARHSLSRKLGTLAKNDLDEIKSNLRNLLNL